MTLRDADKRLRNAYYGVRVVPVAKRGQGFYCWCSGYGSADDIGEMPCESPIRFIRHPEEEYWFTEAGLFCRECYLRLAEHEGVKQ